MTRKEMLSKLKNIKGGVDLVALSSEGALECTYAFKHGSYYEWCSMEEWPVSLIHTDADTIKSIANKVKSKTLTIEDIKATPFYELFMILNDIFCFNNLSISIFSDLSLFCNCSADNIFVVINSYEEKITFYDNYDEMAIAFEKMMLPSLQEWEENDDDDLLEWVESIDLYSEIPYKNIGNIED